MILKKSKTKISLSNKKTKFIKQKNKELQLKDFKIKSSLNVALTIQESVLPDKNKLDLLLKEYFIIYRPKDVVSGDFYWLHKTEEKTFIASVDCTGHGVPGAFMALIGNILLDKIIKVWQITNPCDILARLDSEIQVILKQKDKGYKSGMDLSVVAMEPLKNQQTKLTFAGAKSDIYIVYPNSDTIEVIKGDRKSIGSSPTHQVSFINHEFTLPFDSLLYMGSDGYKDQNDANREKIGNLLLQQTLLSVRKLPLKEQKAKLEKLLKKYLIGTEQRDDILLIGIRV